MRRDDWNITYSDYCPSCQQKEEDLERARDFFRGMLDFLLRDKEQDADVFFNDIEEVACALGVEFTETELKIRKI